MAKRTVSPIMTWSFWSIGVLGVFLTVTWDYFVAGFSADASYITWIIVFFFALGYGARALAPVFALPTAWRVLDLCMGLVMWAIAAKLVLA